MSFPNIPNVTPSISLTRTQAIDLLLSSIAFEELGLAHLLNAEGEKIQSVLGTLPGLTAAMPSVSALEAIDTSLSGVLQNVIKKEMLLGFKLEDILGLITQCMLQTFTFTFTGALQTFTVPENACSVTIQAVGAAGGAASFIADAGNGVSIQGDFSVTPGEILSVLVGEQGQGGNFLDAGGGGGGSFVWSGNGFGALNLSSLLIAAGGGGGAGGAMSQNGFDGETGESGSNGGGPYGGNGGSGGTGGGAGGGTASNGGGGAGIIANGGSSGAGDSGTGGTAIDAGAAGGAAGSPDVGAGGFGGGGGAGGSAEESNNGGGGGGFSGGGGGGSADPEFTGAGGGGGGSFNNGTNPVNTPGVGTGNGMVVITFTPCNC